jgi:hypothetical protein
MNGARSTGGRAFAVGLLLAVALAGCGRARLRGWRSYPPPASPDMVAGGEVHGTPVMTPDGVPIAPGWTAVEDVEPYRAPPPEYVGPEPRPALAPAVPAPVPPPR